MRTITLEAILPKISGLDQIFSRIRHIFRPTSDRDPDLRRTPSMKIESGTNRQSGLPLLLLLFLEGITVDIPLSVSQLLAPKGHESDLLSRRILQDQRKRIIRNCQKS